MNLHAPGPDMLSSEQITEAIASPRRLRWWAPAMWLYILSMTLIAFGVWTWVDAEADLHLASHPHLVATSATITSISSRGSRSSRYGIPYDVRYEFAAASLTFTGNRLSPYDGLTPANASAVSQYLKPGATVPIKYVPNDPARSFIDAAAWTNLSAEADATHQSRIIGIAVLIVGLVTFATSAWKFFTAMAHHQRGNDSYAPN